MSIVGVRTTETYAQPQQALLINPLGTAGELSLYEAGVIHTHLDEVPAMKREWAWQNRQEMLTDGRACETYRRVTPDAALTHFDSRQVQ